MIIKFQFSDNGIRLGHTDEPVDIVYGCAHCLSRELYGTRTRVSSVSVVIRLRDEQPRN